ncbi:MAG: threonine aldolase [Negativicutes bacterium]|nr:threonine aldolase [Negativicutes bacterium]
MYFFINDYGEGAHAKVLQALTETNFEQTVGYGMDEYCSQAADLIRCKIASPQAAVHFLVGGTQVNLTVLSAIMQPYQAVIAAKTGHIFVHETGAIEATGHKVLAVETPDGKLTPELILPVLLGHPDEHMVQPKVVFISDATEIGTLYTLAELTALSQFCQTHRLYLYLDGARLATALTGEGNDISLPDLARLTDAFYIGGTKNGALFGEALVINHPALQEDFRYSIKQRGGLLAKGRLLGLQFLALLQDDLYFQIAAHANQMAQRLQTGIAAQGYGFLTHSATNQIFPIFPDAILPQLQAVCRYEVWGKADAADTVVRFVTSWATKEESVEGFLQALAKVRA